MKMIFGLAACLALVLGFSSAGFAGGMGASVRGGLDSPMKSLVIPQTSGSTYTINSGQTVGPQVVGAPYTSVVNNGTINGGSSTALTTVPTVANVTNNGAITSSTGGVSMTGGPSVSLVNNGTISVSNTSVSANTATATASGVTLSTGP